MARSAINYIYDSDLSFRAPGSAAVTATAVTGTVALDKLNAARGDQRNKLGAEQYAVVLAVSALDTADADEVYTFSVQVGATGAAAVEVGRVIVNGTGQWVILLDAATIEKLDADREEIELNVTIAGTTPSVTFAAWLAYA